MRAAVLFMACLLAAGLLVLLQFNLPAILIGLSSILIIAAYPFMKRISDFPQLVLGLAFNWGVLVAWAAVHGDLGLAPSSFTAPALPGRLAMTPSMPCRISMMTQSLGCARRRAISARR